MDVSQGRIEGGNTEQTALLIKEASRDDIGSYTCELKNDYGTGVSENDIDVDVHCKYPNLVSTFYQVLIRSVRSLKRCARGGAHQRSEKADNREGRVERDIILQRSKGQSEYFVEGTMVFGRTNVEGVARMPKCQRR